ncbi:MAG: sialate O-acetylesterase [Planctomycetota bacterium]
MVKLCAILLAVFVSSAAQSPEDESGKHLFILSGQSNMAGLDVELTFVPTVTQEFGDGNVVVVKDAQGGQPIRRWYRNWTDSEGNCPEGNGDLYDRLIQKVRHAAEDGEFESVSFYWMQGERDAREQHGEVYEQSLDGLVRQLQIDLGRDDIHVVIGRLSDFDMENQRYPHWTIVREAQIEFANACSSGAWIDTDDLNDGFNKQGREISNDLHMSVAGYKAMGRRFALAGIALINGTEPDPNASDPDEFRETVDGTSEEDSAGVAPDLSYQAEQNREYLAEPVIEFSPPDLDDQIDVGTLFDTSCDIASIEELVNRISSDEYGNIDSLLIAHDGRLIVETYFRKGRQELPHFQMSITKSYTAMALGRAKALGYIDDFDQPLVSFLPELDTSNLASGACEVTLLDCLNMHSGIRFPEESARPGPELDLSGPNHASWILSESNPITNESKSYKYQGCDPALAMQVLDAVVPGSAEEFIREEVFGKLGIETYRWQPDLSGLPKAAAGSSVRSRGMLKFGQVILDRGNWNGEQLWDVEFIEEVTEPFYTNRAGHTYSHFWWGHVVEHQATSYHCISGRGAAGQYLIVVPDLNLVVVSTSHNRSNGYVQSPLKFTNDIIIPAFAGE